MTTLASLVLAALLEIGGDAAIRHGLLRSAWSWLALGGATLVAYGLTVNANRSLHFGQLMGLYIAVFFVVSQLVSFAVFDEQPAASLTLGGALIVSGGLVIHLGAR
ncbi:MAG: hypothetical protein E6J79_14560 [Deltaproteobacteria bacterium]|nr:MAG: hypothetical protein E6J79_14560 [Deltaproteobacteria bacterium]